MAYMRQCTRLVCRRKRDQNVCSGDQFKRALSEVTMLYVYTAVRLQVFTHVT